MYKILEEAAPESAEVGLQFETRLYGHMAAVSGLLLSPEYRQRKDGPLYTWFCYHGGSVVYSDPDPYV